MKQEGNGLASHVVDQLIRFDNDDIILKVKKISIQKRWGLTIVNPTFDLYIVFITHTETTIMSTQEPVQDVDVSMQDEEVEDLDTEKSR